MKEWVCMQVGVHRDIGKKIGDMQKRGWRLHTYACSQYEMGNVNHYLLFERETKS